MNEEAIKTYEADFGSSLREAAKAQTTKEKISESFERGFYFGKELSAKSRAEQLYFRLSLIYPAVYFPRSVADTARNIEHRVTEIAKELTDHEQKT